MIAGNLSDKAFIFGWPSSVWRSPSFEDLAWSLDEQRQSPGWGV
ncbi:hypothetical protein SynA1560_01337 [Synechococcus sp. A15-60]|nr:hypothetical protein SynA1560_01337 [Synechococcus sp. A15-60]